MKKDRLSPRPLTHLQVLGDFLERFDCGAVVLLCVLKGEVYPFARWRTDPECGELNLAWILGQCREVDALGYAAHWSAPESCPFPPLLEGLATLSAPLNDEEILRRFMREVECDGAILAYMTIEGGYQCDYFARWWNSPGRRWVQAYWNSARENEFVTLFAGTPAGNGALWPAVYPQLITSVSNHQTGVLKSIGYEF